MYLPLSVTLSLPVASSRLSSMLSSFLAFFRSLRSSSMFRQSLVPSSGASYSSKTERPHMKSTMAMRLGSMALSFRPSASMRKVPSSMSVAIAFMAFLNSLALAILSLNMPSPPCLLGA